MVRGILFSCLFISISAFFSLDELMFNFLAIVVVSVNIGLDIKVVLV